MPIASGMKPMPSTSIRNAHRESGLPGSDVRANDAERQSGHRHHHRLDHRALRNDDGGDETAGHEGRVVGGFDAGSNRRQRDGQRRQQERADRAAHEGAERGNREGQSCTALSSHRMAVQQVTVDEASPGRLTRTAVINPPYCAP